MTQKTAPVHILSNLYPGLHVLLTPGYLSGQSLEQPLRALELVPASMRGLKFSRRMAGSRVRFRAMRRVKKAGMHAMMHVSADAASVDARPEVTNSLCAGVHHVVHVHAEVRRGHNCIHLQYHTCMPMHQSNSSGCNETLQRRTISLSFKYL